NTNWNVSEDVGWLNVSPMSGSGNGSIIVNYDVNTTTTMRTGQITVTTTDKRPAITVTVTQSGQIPPTVFSVGGGGSYCAGTSPTGVAVTLSGSQLNMTYQLMRNGTATGPVVNGTGNALQWPNQTAGTYTINASNGYQVVSMSGSALIVEMPLLPVSVNIQASSNNICAGIVVNFTANPVNGGTNPQYQWKVNGSNQGTNSPFFAYEPVNGDMVNVILTSDANCVSGNPATSNTVNMVVNPLPQVSWSNFEPDTLCIFWQPVQLSGGLPSGGTYSGPGVSGNMFSPTAAGQGLHILTYTYTTTFNCSASANFTVYVDLCTSMEPLSYSKGQIFVYPNPSDQQMNVAFNPSSLIATGYVIINPLGQVLREYSGLVQHKSAIDINGLAKGLYILQINFGNHQARTNFMVK
ncbi:MAG TPA: T9SS type A sorting domain-containing protein, partial [Bacteroidales bacterium]|nr:T9SS type A sorting domain-containing protein [Bacteroidales bacterium]